MQTLYFIYSPITVGKMLFINSFIYHLSSSNPGKSAFKCVSVFLISLCQTPCVEINAALLTLSAANSLRF